MPLPQTFLDLAHRVNNWGRWGEDDQRGTLNFLTDDVVRDAARAVRSGRTFSLAMPLGSDGPQAGLVPGRDNPVHTMIAVNDAMTGDDQAFAQSDDRLDLALQAATHWDALAHVSHSGRLWNGRPASTVTDEGASWAGIDRVGPVVGRGVLLDVPRALGVGRLDGGHALTPEDLEAAERHARVKVGRGDLVLVRTGQVQHLDDEGDRIAYAFPSPGLSMQTVPWFHEREVAAVATDTLAFEVFPGEVDDLFLPVHLLHLVEMGLMQGQNFHLEALAADCADDGQYDFLLSATPEPVVAGLGAPVAPVAVK